MESNFQTVSTTQSVISTNKVLRNTYALLSMTLLFSAFTAFMAVQMNVAPMPWLLKLVVMIGLLFLTHMLRNSVWGLVSVFAFTGFMGFAIGPIINLVTQAYSNGGQMVAMALGSTGAIFLGLSGIALTTKRDFSAWGKFLFIGLIVAILAMVANYFLNIPALGLAISAMVVLIMSGLILYETQQIVNGGETNYISATVSLYLSIYNLFIHLLHLIMFFMGEE